GRLSSLCRRTPILRAVLPALQAAQRQAQFGAGLRPPRSRRHGVLDQLQRFTAIRGADHSSSSFPQSASAFFRNTSRAAVSASAASLDRKSTRLNSSHVKISYAVFCLKKKIQKKEHQKEFT